ncbi:transcriptional regulator [Quadrisphaera granulorum]|uniref:Transcriptional regulator n=1 Tax=Quadrisphaera granulorum TaxID=317664 RepID=A0A316A5K5_9ACTN|nr:WYL domain-containing protein [Quadrisphaera granulorum]PWJ53186.1 transcriptional regulator [Quadrisphaera granulorum]SZE97118.1 transcriptional regulator [Quadrisphaera granulorum]
MAAGSGDRRTERLLNLVIALLSTRTWLTKEQIRRAVPQYEDCASTEAFDRMFERDKEELRELGVPLVTGSASAWFDDEQGYKVDRDAYALPEVAFTPAELAVLSLAARVWAQASLAGPAARALTKLRALGVDVDEQSLAGIEPRVRTAEPAFQPLYAAARDRQRVTFTYRRPGATEPVRRSVQPWQVTSWHGHWYLVGHDLDREAPRVFRLSRIEGTVRRTGPAGAYDVPDDVDGRAMIATAIGGTDSTVRTAHLRLAAGAAGQLRLRAGVPAADADRDVIAEVAFTDPGELAATAAAAAPHAVVLDPDDVRDAVVRRLRGVIAAHAEHDLRAGHRTDVPRAPSSAAGGAGRRSSGRPPVQPTAADRLSRLLAMVPWVLEHQGAPAQEVADRFGITTDQLVKDLELLFVCGTPGHLPDDLIEAEWEGGRIHIGNADAIARPLRLGIDEALALITGLRTLLDVPGFSGEEDREALTGALAKLTEAAGEAATASRALAVDLARDVDRSVQPTGEDAAAEVLATLREALRHPAGRRRLRLHYLVPSRDETTERDVDPMRLLTVDGRWYLEGWCHRASGVRLFRVDRVVSAAVLDADGTPPPDAVARDVDEQLFTPGDDDLVVTLELTGAARWVAEHVPLDSSEELDDDGLRVVLRTPDDRWLRRLLLPLGGAAVVVDPPEVAEGLLRVAKAALSSHGLQEHVSAAQGRDEGAAAEGGIPHSAGAAPEHPAV